MRVGRGGRKILEIRGLGKGGWREKEEKVRGRYWRIGWSRGLGERRWQIATGEGGEGRDSGRTGGRVGRAQGEGVCYAGRWMNVMELWEITAPVTCVFTVHMNLQLSCVLQAYLHSRMRARTSGLLKILNRARPEAKTEKKTIS